MEEEKWINVLKTIVGTKDLAQIILVYVDVLWDGTATAIISRDHGDQGLNLSIDRESGVLRGEARRVLGKHPADTPVTFCFPIYSAILKKGAKLWVRTLTSKGIDNTRILKVPELYHSLLPHATITLNISYRIEIRANLSTVSCCQICYQYLTEEKRLKHDCVREVACRWCDFTGPTFLHDQHLMSLAGIGSGICPNRSFNCDGCHMYLAARDFRKHWDTACPVTMLEEKCWCNASLQKKTRKGWQDHRVVCPAKPISCPDCKSDIRQDLITTHRENTCPEKVISKHCDCCIVQQIPTLSMTRQKWNHHVCWQDPINKLKEEITQLRASLQNLQKPIP